MANNSETVCPAKHRKRSEPLSREQHSSDNALLMPLCLALTGEESLTLTQFQSLESIASQHAVRALLGDRMLTQRRQDGSITSQDNRALADLSRRETALEARRNDSLIHIIDALALAGVPALIFKGTALAHSHYPRPELRERDDTDSAVDRAHLQVAGDVLQRLGLRPIAFTFAPLVVEAI